MEIKVSTTPVDDECRCNRFSFTDHLRSVGETYFQHQRKAFGFAQELAGAALAAAIHGVLPFTFTRTASNTIRRLYDAMIVHRHSPKAG